MSLVAVASLALTLIAVAAAPSAGATPPAVPVHLTVGDRTRPLDVGGAPQFGWQVRGRAGHVRQIGYEIRVGAEGGRTVWDSGRVRSSQQSYVPYRGPALAPGASYAWSVRIWDSSGRASAWARRARFDTGLADDDWSGAQWIRRATSGNDSTDDYTLARREIAVGAGPVTRARAYVSAMGQYELHVNGHAVGRGDSFDYPGEGQYTATDITRDVRSGRPLALGVLYHYWTCTCQGRANGPASPDGPSGLLVKVVIDHANGTSQTIVSDGGWKVAKAAQFTNSTITYRNGDAGDRVERYDARRELAGWDAPGFDDGSWERPYMIGPHPRPRNPLRDEFSHLDPAVSSLSYTTVHPRSVSRLADGTLVADFGRVIPAMPRLTLRQGQAGRTLSVLTSYRLNNTTLAAPAAAGARAIRVGTVGSFAPGDRITVDAPANGHGAGDPESRTITAVGTAGAGGSGLTLDAPLARSHAADAWIEGSRAGTAPLDTQGSDMHWYYTEKPGAQTAQAFTYWGWRYMQIDAPGAGEPLGREDISAVVQHTAVPAARRATFHSDNRMLDRVFALMRRSGVYSSQETHLDTPTREKGQFLGDTIDISFANMSASGERNATRRAIREFVYSGTHAWKAASRNYCTAEQVPCSYPSLGTPGRLNAVYPNGDNMRDIPDYTEWFPQWVLRYFQASGDRGTLASAFGTMRSVAGYIHRAEAGGLVFDLPGGAGPYQFGIIDWPAPMRYGYTFEGNAARTIHNAEAVGAFRATAAAARALGRRGDAARYDRWADELTAAMNRRLVRPDGLYSDGLSSDAGNPQIANAAQHAQTYPIYFDIAPARDREALADRIVGQGMRQGPMTWHVLLSALASSGRYDQVVRLLTDPASDGPAKILAENGTFMWEQWDPGCDPSPCASPSQTSTESFSHGWGAWGAVDVIESVLGVTVTSPGAATVRIAPPILDSAPLHRVSGSAWTQRGKVGLRWRRARAGMTLEVRVPANVQATVAIPDPGHVRYRATGEGAPRFERFAAGRAMFSVGSGRTRFVPAGRGGPGRDD